MRTYSERMEMVADEMLWYLEDGSIYFDPIGVGGVLSANDLREIADFMDMINEPLEREINEFFEKQEAEIIRNSRNTTSNATQDGSPF